MFTPYPGNTLRQFNLLTFPQAKPASQTCFLDMHNLNPVTENIRMLYYKQYWTPQNTKDLEIMELRQAKINKVLAQTRQFSCKTTKRIKWYIHMG